MLNLIKPNWPAPKNIHAFSTTRYGGVSKQPYSGLNLALHVGDDVDAVYENRRKLESSSGHPVATHWLTQIHSSKVIEYQKDKFNDEADGIFAWHPEQPCVVMTADCLPVLLCSTSGDFVAALHAGWRGLANGILLNGVSSYYQPENLMAWIGPAISQAHFEVGDEVRSYFADKDLAYTKYFKLLKGTKYLADLAGIAEYQLKQKGVEVYQSGLCTFANQDDFYSYRRDGQTGRMASLIWIEND